MLSSNNVQRQNEKKMRIPRIPSKPQLMTMNATLLNLIGLISFEHYEGTNVICSRNDASNNRSSESVICFTNRSK